LTDHLVGFQSFSPLFNLNHRIR